jgi:hypothetical protein
MSDYGQRQINSGNLTRPAGQNVPLESEDAQHSRRETARLQAEAQARINGTRDDTIGSAP